MNKIRVLPLPKVTAHWEHDASKYPDTVKVPMSDGKVVTYRRDDQQPHPCLVEALDGIRRMATGYKAKK